MEGWQKRPLILSIASGKGGVGKTLTTVNMALAARRMGLKTLILDGDLGMANVDIVLGLKARYNINDVLQDQVGIEEALLQGPQGLHIIPSGSGIAKLADLKLPQRMRLLEKIEETAQSYDLLLIDTGAGISEPVLHLNSVSAGIMLVTTPEPHALTDALAFIKVMGERHGKSNVHVIVNQTISEVQGTRAYQGLSDTAKRHLGIEIQFAGSVPRDANMERAVMLQRAGDEQVKHTLAGQAWNEITRRMIERLREMPQEETGRGFSELLFPQLSARNVRAL